MKNTKYFYRVTEFATPMDESKHETIEVHTDFKGENLAYCRKLAFDCYYRKKLMNQSDINNYFLPWASPKKFIQGKHAAWSLDLLFIEAHGEDWDSEENSAYSMMDKSLDDPEDVRDAETEAFKSLGLTLPNFE